MQTQYILWSITLQNNISYSMILYPCVYIKMNTLSRHSEYIGIIILYCIIMTQQISLPIFISPLKHIIYLFFFLILIILLVVLICLCVYYNIILKPYYSRVYIIYYILYTVSRAVQCIAYLSHKLYSRAVVWLRRINSLISYPLVLITPIYLYTNIIL